MPSPATRSGKNVLAAQPALRPFALASEYCASPKPAMRSVEVARTYQVPLHIRSAFTWEPGTWVIEEDPTMEQAVVSAVVPDTSEAKVTVSGVPDRPGIAAEMTERLAAEGISLRGFSAAVSGPRVIVNLALDSLADRDRAQQILDGWVAPERREPADTVVVPA